MSWCVEECSCWAGVYCSLKVQNTDARWIALGSLSAPPVLAVLSPAVVLVLGWGRCVRKDDGSERWLQASRRGVNGSGTDSPEWEDERGVEAGKRKTGTERGIWYSPRSEWLHTGTSE